MKITIIIILLLFWLSVSVIPNNKRIKEIDKELKRLDR